MPTVSRSADDHPELSACFVVARFLSPRLELAIAPFTQGLGAVPGHSWFLRAACRGWFTRFVAREFVETFVDMR